MIGFGSGILALPILAYVIGIEYGVQIVIASSFLTALIVIIQNHKYIVWKSLLKIVIICGLGIPIGLFLTDYLSEFWLNLVLGIFMLFIGVRGLYQILSVRKVVLLKEKARYVFHIFILFLGGIVHGAFGIGGPLVVIYAADIIQGKNNFRATMSMTWVVLNGILLIKNVSFAVMESDTHLLLLMAAVIPAVFLSSAIGHFLQKKISEKTFRILIYGLLVVIGIIYILKLI